MADTGFYAVYLLESAHPRYTGHGYVGFTVDPERRLRQHNGDIQNGAGETRRKRPWAMVLCVHGFPTKTSALQFEWALQHPARSRSIRDAVYTNGPAPRKLADTLKKSACHIHLLHWALQSAPWKDHALTVHVFGDQQEKYAGYLTDPAYRLPAGVPPSFNEGAVTVQIGDWAALHRHRKFVRESEVAEEFDPSNSCSICETPVLSNTQLRCVSDECRLVAHPKCLARSFREAEPPLGPACSGTPSLIPRLPAPCPSCSVELTWPAVLGRSKRLARQREQLAVQGAKKSAQLARKRMRDEVKASLSQAQPVAAAAAAPPAPKQRKQQPPARGPVQEQPAAAPVRKLPASDDAMLDRIFSQYCA